MGEPVLRIERWMQAFEDERQRVATDRLNGFTLDALKRPVFSKKKVKRVRVNREKGSFGRELYSDFLVRILITGKNV